MTQATEIDGTRITLQIRRIAERRGREHAVSLLCEVCEGMPSHHAENVIDGHAVLVGKGPSVTYRLVSGLTEFERVTGCAPKAVR